MNSTFLCLKALRTLLTTSLMSVLLLAMSMSCMVATSPSS